MWSPTIVKILNKKDENINNQDNMKTTTKSVSETEYRFTEQNKIKIDKKNDDVKSYKSKSADAIMDSQNEYKKTCIANNIKLNKMDLFLEDDFDNIDQRILSKYELDEYHDLVARKAIDKIFYMGKEVQKNIQQGISKQSRYISAANDHILYRYQIIEKLGSGAYSDVIKCLDHKHGTTVALKITKNEKKYTQSFENEIKIMSQLLFARDNYTPVSNTSSPLITFIQKRFYWRSHPVIAMNIYNKNLYNSNIKAVPYRIGKVIITDILEGLHFLKCQKIIHCDLKPENVFFLNDDSYNVVIGDFGMSINTENHKEKINYYIQTRWYRSTDVVLNIPYDYSIDMWSAGAIFIELLTNTVVFNVRNEYELLYIAENIIGSNVDIKKLPVSKKSSDKRNLALKIHKYTEVKETYIHYSKLNNQILKVKEKIEEIEPKAIIELIKKIFVWNPQERITPKQALDIIKET